MRFQRIVLLVVLVAGGQVQAQLFHNLKIANDEHDVRFFDATADGKLLVGTTFDEIYVWDGSTGANIQSIKYSADCAAFNRSAGHLLLRRDDRDNAKGLEFFDIKKRTLLPTDITFAWRPLAFSRDGNRLVCEHIDEGFQVFEYPEMAPLFEERIEPSRSMDEAILSPQGTLVAFLSDSEVEIWNTATGKHVARSGRHINSVDGATFSPDETRLAVVGTILGRDGVGVFHTRTLLPTQRRMFASDSADAVSWTTDGSRIVLCGEDIQLVDPESLKATSRLVGVDGERVSVLSDRFVGTTHYSGGPRVWDLHANERVLEPSLVHVTHPVMNGKEDRSYYDRCLHVCWDAEGARLALAFRQPVTKMVSASRSSVVGSIVGSTRDAVADGVWITGKRPEAKVEQITNEFRIKLINAKTGATSRQLSPDRLPAIRKHHVNKLCFTNDGSRLAFLMRGADIFGLWDWKANVPTLVSRETDSNWPYPKDFDMSPDGKHVGFVTTNGFCSYDIETGRLADEVDADLEENIKFISQDEFLSEFSIWDGNTIEQLVEGPDKGAGILVANARHAFSIGFDGTELRGWNLDSLELTEWETNSPMTSLALSHDGTLIAAGCADGKTRIWDTTNGRLVTKLTGHTSSVESVSFHPRSAILASASRDGKTMIWDLRDTK